MSDILDFVLLYVSLNGAYYWRRAKLANKMNFIFGVASASLKWINTGIPTAVQRLIMASTSQLNYNKRTCSCVSF